MRAVFLYEKRKATIDRSVAGTVRQMSLLLRVMQSAPHHLRGAALHHEVRQPAAVPVRRGAGTGRRRWRAAGVVESSVRRVGVRLRNLPDAGSR